MHLEIVILSVEGVFGLRMESKIRNLELTLQTHVVRFEVIGFPCCDIFRWQIINRFEIYFYCVASGNPLRLVKILIMIRIQILVMLEEIVVRVVDLG